MILARLFTNYHFQEVVTDEGIYCDYILYEGISKTRNAIDLLKLLGYSNSIVKEAKERVNTYLETGE